MGRVYDDIKVNGGSLNTIFDPGAIRSYITVNGRKKASLKIFFIKKPFKTGLGGKRRKIEKYCDIQGKIKKNHFDIRAYLVGELGRDDKEGKEIDLLFGALDMQTWNIQLDLEKEKLDLSRFRKEFIEYGEC